MIGFEMVATPMSVAKPQLYPITSSVLVPFLAKYTLLYLDETRGANAKSKILAQLVAASNTNQVHIENPALALIAPKLRLLIRKNCPLPEESLIDESTAHWESYKGLLDEYEGFPMA